MQLPTAARAKQYEPDAHGVLESLHEAPKAIVAAAVQLSAVVESSVV